MGSQNGLRSPTESKQFTDSTHMNGQKAKLNGDLDEPIPTQRKSTLGKKLVGGVAVLPTLSRMMKDDDQKEKTSPVIYDYEPGRRTIPDQVCIQSSLVNFLISFCLLISVSLFTSLIAFLIFACLNLNFDALECSPMMHVLKIKLI